jgi:hypothetical protein
MQSVTVKRIIRQMIEGFHQEATNYQQAKNDQTLNFDT